MTYSVAGVNTAPDATILNIPQKFCCGRGRKVTWICKERYHLVIYVVLVIVVFIFLCLYLTKGCSKGTFEKYVIGGTEDSPNNQVQRLTDSSQCESPPFDPPPLNEPLGAHFAVATNVGLVVGGGISGWEDSTHTARSVYFLAYNSSQWVPFFQLKRPRIQSCVQIIGSKIYVTGGTLLDAEMPCDLSTEMLDLDHLENGWQITDYKESGSFRVQSSHCVPLFLCFDPVTVDIHCL